MVDHARLEAVCRKKVNARAMEEIRETVEAVQETAEPGAPPELFWGALAFLLEREKQIDAALAASPPAAISDDDADLQAAESIRYHQARELDHRELLEGLT